LAGLLFGALLLLLVVCCRYFVTFSILHKVAILLVLCCLLRLVGVWLVFFGGVFGVGALAVPAVLGVPSSFSVLN